MNGGMFGKILNVNLSSERITTIEVEENVLDKLIGGKALGLYFLLKMARHPLDDGFAPENPLIIMSGPLSGGNVVGASRAVAISRSPLADYLCESYAGGYFPHHFHRTGWDGVIITGQASEPMYLYMEPGHAELFPASDLWGLSTSRTTDRLIAKHPGSKVACIGPAGENKVRFASLMVDKTRAFGRGGSGAICGSKNLKAIVVKAGDPPPLADPETFKHKRKELSDLFVKKAKTPERFGKLGTTGGVIPLSKMGILPTKNFKMGSWEKASSISGEKMAETVLVGRETCSACPIRCKREVETEFNGSKVEKEHGGPEYETLASFGSSCLNDNLSAICLANQLCNELGLDTISTGNVIAHLMEATERKIVRLEEGATWGDARRIIELLVLIAQREGIGDLLAEGVKRLSKKLGTEDFAIHVKGLEVAMHEPRGKKGLGLSYAVSPRGGSHMEGLHDTMVMRPNPSPELLGPDFPGMSRFSIENKAPIVVTFENARSFSNSLIICAFTSITTGSNYNLGLFRDLLNAATGLSIDAREMLRVGERSWQLARHFAILHGLEPKDDDLPRRFKEESLSFEEGPQVVGENELQQMLKEYYRIRGWDDLGRPTEEKWKELELQSLIPLSY